MNERPESKTSFSAGPKAPFLKASATTRGIMADALIALLPLLFWGCYVFGFRVLTVCTLSVTSAVIFELLFALLAKKPVTIGDLSAVVTGLLIALLLPHTVPLWAPVAGSFFAIVIVKMPFGGLGKNPVNPALSAVALLSLCFSSAVAVPTVITKYGILDFAPSVQSQSDLTPLSDILIPAEDGMSALNLNDLFDRFIGYESGTIGEISALLLLAGLIYLMIRKVVSSHIPLTYLATVALITFFLPAVGFERFNFLYTLSHLCAGSVMLVAVFSANDTTTAPVTAKGRMLYAAGCGILTVLIRYFAHTEGAVYAVLIMNLAVYIFSRLPFLKLFAQKSKKNASDMHP